MDHRSSDGRLNYNKPPSKALDNFWNNYKIHRAPVTICTNPNCNHAKGNHTGHYKSEFQGSTELNKRLLYYTYCKEEGCTCKMFQSPTIPSTQTLSE